MQLLSGLVALGVAAGVPGSLDGAGAGVAPPAPKVVSYFRVDAGWTRMWSDWRPDLVEADLARLASLRANTVRVVVSPGQFGYPRPSETYTKRLDEFVSLAARRGLRVQLTLFDWWYEWADLRGSRTWARELLTPYVGDRRIAFVELKNELALEPHVLAWARAMIPFVRSVLRGRTPVTLSLAGPDHVRRLAELKRGLRSVRPDAFDIHYFGGGGELALDTFTRARAVAAPTPLRVGETGYPTTTTISGFGGVPTTPSAQEAAQAHFFATVGWAARAAGLSPAGVWLLDDLRPVAVPDREVVAADPELHFGLYRTDGTAKPARAAVRSAFSGRETLAFNGGFEEAVVAETGADVPAKWSMQGRVVFSVDRSVAREGRASARVAPGAAATGSGSLAITPPNGGLRGGERIKLGVWARRAGPRGRVFAVIEWFDRANRRLGRAASPVLPPAVTDWRRLSVEARAPRRAAYVRIDLVAAGVAAPVWFDAVSFRSRRARAA